MNMFKVLVSWASSCNSIASLWLFSKHDRTLQYQNAKKTHLQLPHLLFLFCVYFFVIHPLPYFQVLNTTIHTIHFPCQSMFHPMGWHGQRLFYIFQ